MKPSSKKVSPARIAALEILEKDRRGEGFVDALFPIHTQDLTPEDRRLTYTILGGRYRNLFYLDYTLDHFATRSLKSIPPIVREILRTGVFQLKWLDQIPPYAVISESQKLADHFGFKGLKGLISALLRKVEKEGLPPLPDQNENPEEALSLKYSHPKWMTKKFLKEFGEEKTESLWEWDNKIPYLWLRINPLRTTIEEIKTSFEEKEIKFEIHPEIKEAIKLHVTIDPRNLPGYAEGKFIIQDLGAMLAAPLLNPQPGEKILEVGSAPGGKTVNLAVLQKDEGAIYALEPNPLRMEKLKENKERLGLNSIAPVLGELPNPMIPEVVDGVLLDVPCSGLGVMRRRLDLRWRVQPEEIKQLSELQMGLLRKASKYLKPGGILVYSTCTLTPEENQNIIRRFIKENSKFHLEDPGPYLPESFRKFVGDDKTVLLWPPESGTDGVFLARLKRKS